MAKNSKETTSQEDLSKNILGSLLRGYSEDHYNHIIPKRIKFSTGSLKLDELVNLKSGSVVRVVGKGAELGKTSQCLVLAKNYMNAMPKAKTLFIKAEGRLSEELKARSGHIFTVNQETWEFGTIFELKCNIFETIATIIMALLKTMYEQGQSLCIILDSLDGLILKNDLGKAFGESKVAGVPLLTKLLFRKLALPIEAYDSLLLITGQYSANIEIDPYSKTPPRQVESSGGSNIGHQSDYVFQYLPRYNKDVILEKPEERADIVKNKILGVVANIEIKKSASDTTGYRVEIPIKKGKIGNQIWQEREVAETLFSYDWAKKEGAWITFDKIQIETAKEEGIELKEKVHGFNALYDYFETDKKVFEWFLDKIKTIRGS